MWSPVTAVNSASLCVKEIAELLGNPNGVTVFERNLKKMREIQIHIVRVWWEKSISKAMRQALIHCHSSSDR